MLINPDRFRQSIEEMARIGATKGGGVHRLTLSDADKQARDLFAKWADDAGLELQIDEMGNMFARRSGREDDAPPAMAGSHLDSVPNGGRFDGSLGVLAALEAVRTLNDKKILTKRPIEIVNWTNEEGPRFPPSMMGSGVFAGAISLEAAYEARDSEGARLLDELERIGYRGDAPCVPKSIGSYLELHIEQGPALVSEGIQVGVVEGIFGLTWLRVTMKGERDHAGPTPMHMRRDAMVGAARTIAAIREIPGKLHPEFVATVGEFSLSPNAINVIPDEVMFSVDFRHSEPELLNKARKLIEEAAQREAAKENLEVEIQEVGGSTPTAFDESVAQAVRSACEESGYSHRSMWSAAGHDARYAADLGPTAMIFVPCVAGKSHSEEEDMDWEDAYRGCDILARALVKMADS
ncbi:MAG: Zn-dependent hydrolase [Nitrospinae bacterium]|nr:Zn-dependent hydrolase [Nitrospinota bacterium]